MTPVLYTISGSPYGWRVQLALEAKGVAYELRVLSLAAGELAAPAYRALNPRGRVPTLVDGDEVIYESLAILAYVDARWPAPPLLGTTPHETAAIWRVIAEYTAYLDPAVEAFILPIYFGRDLAPACAAMPVITEELARLAAPLARTPYLAGEAPTAADLVVLPHLQSVLRAAGKPAAADLAPPFLPLSPALAAWRTRMEAQPWYAATIPPHWR